MVLKESSFGEQFTGHHLAAHIDKIRPVCSNVRAHSSVSERLVAQLRIRSERPPRLSDGHRTATRIITAIDRMSDRAPNRWPPVSRNAVVRSYTKPPYRWRSVDRPHRARDTLAPSLVLLVSQHIVDLSRHC